MNIRYQVWGIKIHVFFMIFSMKILTIKIISKIWLQKMQKSSSAWVAFLLTFLGNLTPPILAKYKKCVLFSYKYLIKIPLLNEIYPFDNSVNLYSSISGYTFENMSSEKPELNWTELSWFKLSWAKLNRVELSWACDSSFWVVRHV